MPSSVDDSFVHALRVSGKAGSKAGSRAGSKAGSKVRSKAGVSLRSDLVIKGKEGGGALGEKSRSIFKVDLQKKFVCGACSSRCAPCVP